MVEDNNHFEIHSEDRGSYTYIHASGRVKTREELLQFADKLFSEITRYNHTLIYNDMLGMDFLAKNSDYLALVESYENDDPQLVFEWKIAISIRPEFETVGSFWESACYNRGFNYKSYTSEKKALNWLLEKFE